MGPSLYQGKVAIITGGASGIGAALAKELASSGAEVVIADRQVDAGEAVAASIRAAGGRAAVAEVDVRELPSVKRLVDDTVARAGHLDYFFNNAGIAVGGEIDAYTPRDWDDVFDVNLRGVAHGIQAAYPAMIAQGSGHIVNTASMAGLLSAASMGSYAATKHAVVGLSRALRVEARRHGVRVSVLCPGFIRTPILTGGKYGRTNVVGVPIGKMEQMVEQARPMDAGEFARKALRAIARNEPTIILPAWWKAFWYLDWLSPALSERLAGAMLKQMRAQVEAAGGRPATARMSPGAAGIGTASAERSSSERPL